MQAACPRCGLIITLGKICGVFVMIGRYENSAESELTTLIIITAEQIIITRRALIFRFDSRRTSRQIATRVRHERH